MHDPFIYLITCSFYCVATFVQPVNFQLLAAMAHTVIGNKTTKILNVWLMFFN